jgi:hypothetical protein
MFHSFQETTPARGDITFLDSATGGSRDVTYEKQKRAVSNDTIKWHIRLCGDGGGGRKCGRGEKSKFSHATMQH